MVVVIVMYIFTCFWPIFVRDGRLSVADRWVGVVGVFVVVVVVVSLFFVMG